MKAVSNKGPLLLIGGAEDKTVDQKILRRIPQLMGKKKNLLVIVAASQVPKEIGDCYLEAFSVIDGLEIKTLDVRRRSDAYEKRNISAVKWADALFFTGGDQLRLTSQLGGTPITKEIYHLWHSGALIAGTSAGAVAIPRTMIFAREHSFSHPSLNIALSTGFGLIENVVVDSHFSQRDRLSRLCGAVSQNPENLGIGLDEDTAILIHPNQVAEVIGSGAVYFVDGTGITYSSLSEITYEGVASIFGLKVHILLDSDRFSLRTLRILKSNE